MMLIRVTLDTVMSSNQCQEITPLKMPSLLSQSMRLLKLISYKPDSGVKMNDPAYHAIS